MNPLTNVKNLRKMNEKELKLGIAGQDSKSWHQKYKDSAWIFIGGLPYELSEGDVISIFSQYGEIVNINLIRDHKTGKSKGFGFLCYEDQRSTNLAVDNFNGIKILSRIIRVDHVEEYKVPKERGNEDDTTKRLHLEGCAPKNIKREPIDPVVVPKKQKVEQQSHEFRPEKIKDEKQRRPENRNEKVPVVEDRKRNTEDTNRWGGNKRYEDKKYDDKSKRYEDKKYDDKSKKDFSTKSYKDRDAYVPKRYHS